MLSFIVFLVANFSVSFFWLGLFIVYVQQNGGIALLMNMSAPDLSLFIAAVFFPLLLQWLICLFVIFLLGMRRKENQSGQVICSVERLGEYCEAMSRSCMEMEIKVRNEMALKNISLIVGDLNAMMDQIAALLFEKGELVNSYIIFVHHLNLDKSFENTFYIALQQEAALAQVCRLFCLRAELLFKILATYDNDGFLKKIYEEGPVNQVYVFLKKMLAKFQTIRHEEEKTPVFQVDASDSLEKYRDIELMDETEVSFSFEDKEAEN
jgi:hypothetical protein